MTLIELLVAMAVAIILMTMAVPSFRTTILNNQMATQSNEFLTALRLARSEAIKRGRPVTICHSANGASCDGDWEDGWIVFSDLVAPVGTANFGTGNCLANEDCLIQVHQALKATFTLRGNNNVANQVTFQQNGVVGAGAMGTFVMCDERGFGDHARAIVVALTGRMEIRPATDSTVSPTNCSASST